MTRRAGPLGATVYAAPTISARRVATISAGLEVVGDVVRGERIHDEPRWIEIHGYVPVVRLVDEPEYVLPRRSRRTRS